MKQVFSWNNINKKAQQNFASNKIENNGEKKENTHNFMKTTLVILERERGVTQTKSVLKAILLYSRRLVSCTDNKRCK